MKIVLYQPQIPQNTGNVVRTCSVTGNELILVHPLGFSVTDRWLKRAGLDYWEGVSVTMLQDEELVALLESSEQNFYFFSSKATKSYVEVSYQSDDYLIFGSETSGLAPHYLERWPERFVTLPMLSGARCLNLATTVGIAVYEASRQMAMSERQRH